MKRYLFLLPVLIWVFIFILNVSSGINLTKSRLEALNLSRELTIGGFSYIYYISAFASFYDDIFLLIIAILISFKLFKNRI